MVLNDDFMLVLNNLSQEMVDEEVLFVKEPGVIQINHKGQKLFKVQVFSDYAKGKAVIIMKFFEKPIQYQNIYEVVHKKLIETFCV